MRHRALIGVAVAAIFAAAVPGGAASAEGDGVAARAAPAAIPRVLAEAARRAATEHPTVRSRLASRDAAESDVSAAKWLRFPSVTVEGIASPNENRVSSGSLRGNVSVELPIWTAGRISENINRAEALVLVSEARAAEAARQNVLDLIEAYYLYVRSRERVRVLQESRVEADKLEGTIQNRVEAQLSPLPDLALARARGAQLNQELATAQLQATIALQKFQVLAGAAVQIDQLPAYDPALHHPSVENIYEQALACDPTLARLKAERLVARADTKIARAQTMPQLNAQYLHDEFNGDRVGLVLRAQTSGGLSQFSAARSAREREEAAAIEAEAAARAIRDTMAVDLAENVGARERMADSGAAAIEASLVVESYKTQFDIGRRTWLDVMNALREATNAQLGETDTKVSAMASTARLLAKTCRWIPDAGAFE